MLVLAVNSGSSSLKCAAVDPDSGELCFQATVQRVGTREAELVLGDSTSFRLPGAGHAVALERTLAALRERGDVWSALAGVGHRVVHGGEDFTESCLIDDSVERAIERTAQLAPLHNPANLLGIRAARKALDHLPHVAVFDTAFHQTLTDSAFRYAVPESWYLEHKIRRYGFHGTSHRYVAQEAASVLGRPLTELQLLSAHLGNGCSATAIANGRSVDTTMGFTPLEGLVMGTRSGDLDPAVIFHLIRQCGMSAAEVERVLNEESGLLGLSGLSNDLRTLSESSSGEHPGSQHAQLAIDVFCHRLAKHLGALATNLSGLDALVFTGGIGEHSSEVRRRACQRLAGLGVLLDETANRRSSRRCDAPSSRVAVLIIPTNEELMIARDTRDIMRGRHVSESEGSL